MIIKRGTVGWWLAGVVVVAQIIWQVWLWAGNIETHIDEYRAESVAISESIGVIELRLNSIERAMMSLHPELSRQPIEPAQGQNEGGVR
jgi:hypothetical protein